MFRTENIRRLLLSCLAFLFLPVAAACSLLADPDVSCLYLANEVVSSQPGFPVAKAVSTSDSGFDAYLDLVYGIVPGTVEDGAVVTGSDAAADEIAVLRMKNQTDAGAAKNRFQEYITKRLRTFTGYSPANEQMLDDAVAAVHGKYVTLFICQDPSAAQTAFSRTLANPDAAKAAQATPLPAVSASAAPAETPTPAETIAPVPESAEPAPADDTYNHDAIVAAWQTGDQSALTPLNLAVFEQASGILSSVITSEMTPYEKELAVHDALTERLTYDPRALGREDAAAALPESSTPVGALLNGEAICYGYSSSFQLLMDMLGIECITINGTANEANEAHSWNAVRLDGSWYFVDVGWDDPVNGTPHRIFFNRPSNGPEFQSANRKWDESAVPEAAGGPWEGPN